MAVSINDRITMNRRNSGAIMRTIKTLIFITICEMTGKISWYADRTRRRADRAEYWAARRRDQGRDVPTCLRSECWSTRAS